MRAGPESPDPESPVPGGPWRPWQEAWHQALYGPEGFYRRPEGPAGHFRTAAHASSSGLLGVALARLAREAGCTRLVDAGAGRGELLASVAAADPGLELLGVDVVPRPAGLPAGIDWSASAPPRMPRTLLVGWELLDVVPCPVLEVSGAGAARVVEVAPCGAERLGTQASAPDLAWCARWWPLDGLVPGDRVEVGRARDACWASLVDRVSDGLALAVDYGHLAAARPAGGTLTGYRRGRQVPAVPDGSCDVTAHVALDAVAAVADGATLVPQHTALRRLGVRATRLDPRSAAGDPMAWLAALATSSEAAELTDPGGLGAFGWVLHPRGHRARQALTEWTSGAPS